MTDYKTLFNAVIAEINAGVMNVKNCLQLFHKRYIIQNGTYAVRNNTCLYIYHDNGSTYWYYPECKSKKDWSWKCMVIATAFGRVAIEILNDDKIRILGHTEIPQYMKEVYKRTDRCGIEILGMKAYITKDGKYKYNDKAGCDWSAETIRTIKELKQSCKDNGIKGYSKMDKLELVKVLMKC